MVECLEHWTNQRPQVEVPLSLCTDVPPPSEKNREKREGGRLYTG